MDQTTRHCFFEAHAARIQLADFLCVFRFSIQQCHYSTFHDYYPQCQGEAFLLLIFSKENSVSKVCDSIAGLCVLVVVELVCENSVSLQVICCGMILLMKKELWSCCCGVGCRFVVIVADEEGEEEESLLSCMNLYHMHIVRMQGFARCIFCTGASNTECSRFYANAVQRRFRTQQLQRVDHLYRVYARCIIVSLHPSFGEKIVLPIGLKASMNGAGSCISLPFMHSWFSYVLCKRTEDWLPALECRPVGTDGTI